MSSNIWTLCGAKPNVAEYRGRAWRVVEAQHVIATRRLVDTDEEHAILEDLIEQSKPPIPRPAGDLHYLLSTPFRYPPLKRGSRFGTPTEMGIWYGSEEPRTAFAEVAYYRLLLLAGTAAGPELSPLHLNFTAFTADIGTSVAVDLTSSPFFTYRMEISSKVSYVVSQPLGSDMRKAGVEAFRYTSARDVNDGANVGIFSPKAFRSKKPRSSQRWFCVATTSNVEFSRKAASKRSLHRFLRDEFLVNGVLPAPAI